MAMLYPSSFYRYVMQAKGFLIYPNRGIACALNNNSRHEQHPFDNLLQNNYTHGVYKIPS
jgi:hypothetical protein